MLQDGLVITFIADIAEVFSWKGCRDMDGIKKKHA